MDDGSSELTGNTGEKSILNQQYNINRILNDGELTENEINRVNTASSSQPTTFSAYPLDSSPNLLDSQNDVIYMPINPTDFSLSLNSDKTTEKSYSQPICHGFIFPHSPENAHNKEFGLPTLPVKQLQNQSCSNSNLQSQILNKIEPNSQRELQLFLLQQLITLQLSQQYSLNKNLINIPQSNVLSQIYDLSNQLKVPQEMDLHTSPELVKEDYDQKDRSTFIVPVQAKFNKDSSLSLYVSPRDNCNNDIHSGSEIMQCSDQGLVLYPSAMQSRNNTEDLSLTDDVLQNKVALTNAQTFSFNDIHQCIKRGSIDLSCDQNLDFVNSIRGSFKPGFVLLSVRHEKINNDLKATQTSAMESQQIEDNKTGTNLEGQKRVFKKRLRCFKNDIDQKRRSLRRSSKVLLKVLENESILQNSFGLTEDDIKSLASQSRFRVTRFADKKQTWLAPSAAGCFFIHDLWTTKLPEYVVKCVEENKNCVNSLLNKIVYINESSYIAENVTKSYCVACENRLRTFIFL